MLLAKSSCGLWWWLGSLPPPPPIHAIKGWVNHCSHIQHCLEAFDLCIYLHAVFG
jgi:hypothetical protein